MGVFRKSSNGSLRRSSGSSHTSPRKSLNRDEEHLKLHTAQIHDPILEAVQEAQPFEQAAGGFHNNISSLNNNGGIRDVFGKPILEPDVSNPTRSRSERPLDTIRGFEYSISGDPMWLSQLDSDRYGFRVRPDFKYNVAGGGAENYGYGDPSYAGYADGGYYAEQQYNGQNHMYGGGSGAPVNARVNGSSGGMNQTVFHSPASSGEATKGKKSSRGFLRRK